MSARYTSAWPGSNGYWLTVEIGVGLMGNLAEHDLPRIIAPAHAAAIDAAMPVLILTEWLRGGRRPRSGWIRAMFLRLVADVEESVSEAGAGWTVAFDVDAGVVGIRCPIGDRERAVASLRGVRGVEPG